MMPAETPTLDDIFARHFEEERITPTIVRTEVVYEVLLRNLISEIEMALEDATSSYKEMMANIEQAKNAVWKAFEEAQKIV